MTANGHIKDPHPGEIYSLINTYTNVCPDIGDLNVNGKCCIFIKRVNLDTDIIYVPHWYGYCYYYNSYFDNITELYPPFTLKHMLTKSWEEYCDRMFVRGEMNNYKYSKKMELFFEINPEFKDIQEELMSKETREYKYNNRYKIKK